MLKQKLFVLLILSIAVFIFFSIAQGKNATPAITEGTDKSTGDREIIRIKATNDLSEQVKLYTKLIERVGPEDAQEALYNSGLSFDGQTHLLNHTVGDWLYEKYGTGGLTFCKDYFLSSCYHGFVIHAIADRGFDGLSEIMNTCWQKGAPTATQCAHAIGHGFLANVGYANLLNALKQCDELGKLSKNFPTYNCHDGVFMENIWAVHEDGKPSKDRWVKDTDPVYPCNDPRVEFRYIKACWSNQPMRMYQMFGGDVARIGQYCLIVRNEDHKKICFDGLARQIHPVTKGNATEVFRLCDTMPKEWVDACVISIVKSEFGVGGRELPFLLCAKIKPKALASCYKALGDIIKSYYPNDKRERALLCRKIPDSHLRDRCLD